MNKSENSVMKNYKNVTKIQTSGSNWINREDKLNFFQHPLGCAYAIDDMASIQTSSIMMNTHINGTGEAGDRIRNMWRQLGGVASHSPKRQYEKPSKSAHSKMKNVAYTTMVGVIFIYTINWTEWLTSPPYGERKLTQRNENEVEFRSFTTTKFKLRLLPNPTKMQHAMSSRHPDIKEGMLMPGPIMINDRSGIQTSAWNITDLERMTTTNLQPQPQQSVPTFKMSDGHRDLKEGVYKPRSINNNDLSGFYEDVLPTANSIPTKTFMTGMKINIISCNFTRRLWEA